MMPQAVCIVEPALQTLRLPLHTHVHVCLGCTKACFPVAQDVVTYRAQTYVPDTVANNVDAKPAPLPGSLMAFTVNGVPQGVAYRLSFSSPHCFATTS